MEECLGYSIDCFNCEKSFSNYCVSSTGAGMDIEMLHDFGKRRLAINCPSQEGMLIVLLTQEQIRKMTNGKLEEISEEAANKKLINVGMVSDYLTNNKDKIKIEIIQTCKTLPPYP